jgi:hypothetical protein
MDGRGEKVCKVLVGNPEGKRPLRRPRCRWQDGIGEDVVEIGWEGAEWIHFAQDRGWWQTVGNAVMNIWVLVAWIS